MLEKLAKQTAIYGISTIVVRFLNYLLTPYFTRVFDPGIYGITVDVYALIPFALVILTMGMESGYFRFAAKADEAGGDVTAAKRRLFATTWGITSLAALLFFGLVTLFRTTVSEWMGADYAANPDFVVWVAAIIFLDVCTAIPFARLREQGRGTGGTEFQAWRTCLPDFPKNGGFTRCGSGWLDRPTIGADAEGSRGFRRARRRNANQVWLVTHFSPSLT